MALAAPAGPISAIADRLGTMLAACTAWSSLNGTIYHNHLPDPSNKVSHTAAEIIALRPFALIWTTDDGYRVRRVTSGGGVCHEGSGQLVIRIERNATAGETPAELDRSWENIIGLIISGTQANPGLINLAADPSYLPISSVSLVDHSRTDPAKIKDIGDAQRALLLVEWSTQ